MSLLQERIKVFFYLPDAYAHNKMEGITLSKSSRFNSEILTDTGQEWLVEDEF
jgi:hypothetical protein